MSDSLFAPWVEIANTPLPVDGSGVTQPVSGTVGVNNFPATQPVSGSVSVSNFPATQPVSGTVAVSSVGGVVNVLTALAATSTITQVVLSNNTNGTILAANPNRKSAIIFVPSQTLQIKYGAVASTTSFTYKVAVASTTLVVTGWAGQIDAFGTGQTVTITELV